MRMLFLFNIQDKELSVLSDENIHGILYKFPTCSISSTNKQTNKTPIIIFTTY